MWSDPYPSTDDSTGGSGGVRRAEECTPLPWAGSHSLKCLYVFTHLPRGLNQALVYLLMSMQASFLPRTQDLHLGAQNACCLLLLQPANFNKPVFATKASSNPAELQSPSTTIRPPT